MAFIRMKESLWHRHKNCQVAVERNYQPKKLSGINARAQSQGIELAFQPALVCRTHGRWLKWLSHEEADQIEEVIQ